VIEERERARLFVALELPRETRELLSGWCPRRRELRQLAPESLHVTLCFLGWRWADEIPAIGAACELVANMPAPELAIGRPLWLPPRRPGVLAVELEDRGGGLGRAQAALSAALVAGGWFAPETRPFLAHVTVARVRKGARAPRDELSGPPATAITADAVTLYRSRLLRGGAQYEPQRTVRLSAPA
jgi:RNA 2',3'-cyclic 3'-phosphodiesterase